MPIYLCSVYGCFHTTKAELSGWQQTVWLMKLLIFTIWPCCKFCQSLLQMTNVNPIFKKEKWSDNIQGSTPFGQQFSKNA